MPTNHVNLNMTIPSFVKHPKRKPCLDPILLSQTWPPLVENSSRRTLGAAACQRPRPRTKNMAIVVGKMDEHGDLPADEHGHPIFRQAQLTITFAAASFH